MSKENKSRYALLGALSYAPMSGYDLKKFMEGSTSNFWNESYAQIYPMLKQLTNEGLTVSHTERQEGRPERHVYALTDKGWEELRRWLAEPAERQVERNELLLKLFFGTRVSVATNIEHIQRYRGLVAGSLQQFEGIEATIKTQYAENPELPYWLITLSYGKHISQALLNWCDETINILQKQQEAEKAGTPS
ncbi:MAG TPA: PadR family transcriptional regulator [Ktedonobacteraceae bacterium]|nr:PadR family transcriptional regulator [Ktedonobacteraceae bacterium]